MVILKYLCYFNSIGHYESLFTASSFEYGGPSAQAEIAVASWTIFASSATLLPPISNDPPSRMWHSYKNQRFVSIDQIHLEEVLAQVQMAHSGFLFKGGPRFQ